MNTVTVTRTTTINAETAEIIQFACADAREAKGLIKLAVAEASSDGFQVCFTSRLDAKASLQTDDYVELVEWVAEYDNRASAKWAPTAKQQAIAAAHNSNQPVMTEPALGCELDLLWD